MDTLSYLLIIGIVVVYFIIRNYYEFDYTSAVSVIGHKLRIVKDYRNRYQLQKRYWPGFWRTISGRSLKLSNDVLDSNIRIFYTTKSRESADKFLENLESSIKDYNIGKKKTVVIKEIKFYSSGVTEKKENNEPKN